MRDYDNMPVLDWRDDKAPQKAKAQILRQEPVVLQMPDDFDASLVPSLMAVPIAHLAPVIRRRAAGCYHRRRRRRGHRKFPCRGGGGRSRA